ncbi:MAG TPA: ATP-binding protein [Candidatus Eisenbacteria bacterium]|nr:ATP-binding protein [Candidatus Eisenbacteria bacterium]
MSPASFSTNRQGGRARRSIMLADAVLRINASLALSHSSTSALGRVIDIAREFMGAHEAFVRVSTGDDWLRAVSSSEEPAESCEYLEAAYADIHALVCRTANPVRLSESDLARFPAFQGAAARARGRRFPPRALLAVPLTAGDESNLGLMQFVNKSAREFTLYDEAVALRLGDAVASAMQNHRLYAELQESVRCKDRFLVTLGHELRNPLAIISTATELLRRLGPPDARVNELRDMISGQVRQMNRLIEDLLDVTRIGQGKIALRKEQCDLVSLVCRTVDDNRPLLAESGLELRMDVPDQPLWVSVDHARIAQVVGNLLCNAIKFTEKGGTVTVRLRKASAAETCELMIVDTGIGMDSKTLANIFEPFHQAQRSSQRSRGGLGLGLALVKGLVELHGGEVRAFSEGPGCGSEVRITLPLEKRSVNSLPDLHAHNKLLIQNNRSYRILIIEDNQLAAACIQMCLRESGHVVEVTHTGSAGIELARRFHPEVVLCDIGLPDLDGYAVARVLRREEALARPRLIAISGYGQEEDRRQAGESGFDVHLTKPFDMEDLQRILSNLAVP